jgi:glycosyltransferase involved in cell wall biosynthesis
MYIEPIAHLAGGSEAEIRSWVSANFGPLTVKIYVGHWDIRAADVSLATNWPTARTVVAHKLSLFKGYFIQDFEPSFYPPSDPSARRAEKTYWFPLRHICLGSHLANHIRTLTERPSDSVDFALDPAFALRQPTDSRGEVPRVLFFARPGLRRRGYEIGVEALRLVKQRHPFTEIQFFGATAKEIGDVGFEFENLGVLAAPELAAIMNRAHILLSFSLSNISNVPFEGMACGCAVVEVDVPSVRQMVSPGMNCLLARPEPAAVAEAIARLIQDPILRNRLATEGVKHSQSLSWNRSGQQLEQILREMCFVRLPAWGFDRIGS